MKSQHHVLSLCSTKELENLEQKRSQHIAIETSCTHERRKDFRSIFTFKKKFFKFLFMIFFFFFFCFTLSEKEIYYLLFQTGYLRKGHRMDRLKWCVGKDQRQKDIKLFGGRGKKNGWNVLISKKFVWIVVLHFVANF